jgi:hypothetical protein
MSHGISKERGYMQISCSHEAYLYIRRQFSTANIEFVKTCINNRTIKLNNKTSSTIIKFLTKNCSDVTHD